MELYQQKHLPLKWKLPSKNILYIATIKSDKKNYQPRNYKRISENTFKNNTQTIKYHSTSTDIKTIRNYPSSTGT